MTVARSIPKSAPAPARGESGSPATIAHVDHCAQDVSPDAPVQDAALTAAWAEVFRLDARFAALVADWNARDAELSAVQASRGSTVFFKANRRDAGDAAAMHAGSMLTKGNGR